MFAIERSMLFSLAKALATLIDESDILKANSRELFFLDWQWVRPVNCLASRSRNSIWNLVL
jgi:hypothetical protein